jgi:ubiquitin C-terminal hydrolase
MDVIEQERKSYMVPGVVGLLNIGNTCYLNSALQCLLATDTFVAYLIGSDGDGKDANYKNDLMSSTRDKIAKKENCERKDVKDKILYKTFKSTLTYSLRRLFVVIYGENCKIRPKSFKETLDKKNPLFEGYMQHDSQECLSFILEKIHDETMRPCSVEFQNVPGEVTNYVECYRYLIELLSSNCDPQEKRARYIDYMDFRKDKMNYDVFARNLIFWQDLLKNNNSVINNIFSGSFIQQIQCNECKNVSVNFESYNIIPLSLSTPPVFTLSNLMSNESKESSVSIYECFNDFFNKQEILSNENMYNCEYCKKKCDAIKSTKLYDTPPRLIIQLKRFLNAKSKNTITVNFPIKNLQLGMFMSEYLREEPVYDLYAVIMHKGGIQGGHYIAYTKNIVNGLWYMYDDATVIHIPDSEIEKIINSYAYILFYKKR